MSKKLPHTMENVCLSTDEEAQMYAVGSKANTDLLDARTLQAIKKIPSRNNGCGIRSVSFKGNILTIGTGVGMLLFWDLRASKFLESTMNSNRAVNLKTSKGWVVRTILTTCSKTFQRASIEYCCFSSGTTFTCSTTWTACTTPRTSRRCTRTATTSRALASSRPEGRYSAA